MNSGQIPSEILLLKFVCRGSLAVQEMEKVEKGRDVFEQRASSYKKRMSCRSSQVRFPAGIFIHMPLGGVG